MKDVKSLFEEFEHTMNEQNGDYLDCIKEEEESNIEEIFNRKECKTLYRSFKPNKRRISSHLFLKMLDLNNLIFAVCNRRRDIRTSLIYGL